jgi:hypothetical protein
LKICALVPFPCKHKNLILATFLSFLALSFLFPAKIRSHKHELPRVIFQVLRNRTPNLRTDLHSTLPTTLYCFSTDNNESKAETQRAQKFRNATHRTSRSFMKMRQPAAGEITCQHRTSDFRGFGNRGPNPGPPLCGAAKRIAGFLFVKKAYGESQIPRSGFKNRDNGLESYLAGKEGYGGKKTGLRWRRGVRNGPLFFRPLELRSQTGLRDLGIMSQNCGGGFAFEKQNTRSVHLLIELGSNMDLSFITSSPESQENYSQSQTNLSSTVAYLSRRDSTRRRDMIVNIEWNDRIRDKTKESVKAIKEYSRSERE